MAVKSTKSPGAEDANLQVIKLVNHNFRRGKRKLARVVFKPERDHVKLNAARQNSLEARENFDHPTYDRIIARIKLMSALDISETRLPQDGRMLVKVENELVDIRVQLVPTVFGEQILLFSAAPMKLHRLSRQFSR